MKQLVGYVRRRLKRVAKGSGRQYAAVILEDDATGELEYLFSIDKPDEILETVHKDNRVRCAYRLVKGFKTIEKIEVLKQEIPMVVDCDPGILKKILRRRKRGK